MSSNSQYLYASEEIISNALDSRSHINFLVTKNFNLCINYGKISLQVENISFQDGTKRLMNVGV